MVYPGPSVTVVCPPYTVSTNIMLPVLCARITCSCFWSAGCDYTSVDRLNKGFVNPLLKQVVQTPYFTYFKASLWCDCPFWPDDGMCMLRDCSVCECEPDEVPRAFKEADSASCGAHCSASWWCPQGCLMVVVHQRAAS